MKEKLMREALELALKGKGKTSPNPMVGAIIYNNGKIVGKGYHKKAGANHAEINAIVDAKKSVKGSALYVTLEPCCHKGKTPPCTKEIIKSGIKKVVIGMKDPNPLVSGKGIKELKKAGLEVKVGLLEKKIKKMNESYIKHITTGNPFVYMKVGMSLDGKIATSSRESKWITSDKSRKQVHILRSEVDAVMVGIGTQIQDDPSLTINIRGKKNNPIRIVVDSKLRISKNSNIIDSADKFNTIIVTTEKSHPKKRADIVRRGIEVIVVSLKDGKVNLLEAMQELGKKGIISIMLEGGSELNASALKEGVVDKVIFFIAPKIIGGTDAVCSIGGKSVQRLKEAAAIKDISFTTVGDDIMVEGYL